jgi:hypothetical protein
MTRPVRERLQPTTSRHLPQRSSASSNGYPPMRIDSARVIKKSTTVLTPR